MTLKSKIFRNLLPIFAKVFNHINEKFMRKVIKFWVAFTIMLTMGISSIESQVEGCVIIGKQSNGCKGIGFCSIELESAGQRIFEHNPQRGAENMVEVKTTINENKNTYTVAFSVKEFNKKNPEKMKDFEKGKFEVEEDIRLSAEAANAYKLKHNKTITLKRGIYDMKIKGDMATVEIDLK